MASGRKHHGRPPHLDAGRVTRTAAKVLATHTPGARYWREQHERKTAWTFCEALQQERAHYGHGHQFADDRHLERRGVYPCRYGDHWLIETGPLHWHMGRHGQRVYLTHRV